MLNMDRLFESVAEKGHVCAGLDTAPEYVPSYGNGKTGAEAVLEYNKRIIDATIDIAACYKMQIAYYEALGIAGMKAYAETLAYLRGKNALVIADVKRGDIADTARHYAKAHFEGDFEADFVTLSPYMGMDSVEPWLEYAEKKGKGAFVLMRTSNAGMKDFEYLELRGGGGISGADGAASARRLYDAVAEKLALLAGKYPGKHGYGAFGAVMGCTERGEAEAIRRRYRNLFFLIPGYGAQGGGAEDAALLFENGNGGVVNASRSILTAWKKNAAPERAALEDAANAAREEAIKMRDALRRAARDAARDALSGTYIER